MFVLSWITTALIRFTRFFLMSRPLNCLYSGGKISIFGFYRSAPIFYLANHHGANRQKKIQNQNIARAPLCVITKLMPLF